MRKKILYNSYRTTLVYNFGSEAGFFSEVNNMVLAFLYCEKEKIDFVLYSENSSFGTWRSYFMPFCRETFVRWHSKLNYRQPYFVPVGKRYKFFSQVFKFFFGFDYYTYELWPFFHNREFEKMLFEKDEENNGALTNRERLREACKDVLDLVWRYNKSTESEISNIIDALHLPEDYISIHVRRGDKSDEVGSCYISEYMEKLNNINCDSIFVASDDYAVVREVLDSYPRYRVYTLTENSKCGYSQNQFERLNINEKRKEIISLLATVEVLCNSRVMVGTYSSNIGMFCGMRMEKGRFIGVDGDDWMIW